MSPRGVARIPCGPTTARGRAAAWNAIEWDAVEADLAAAQEALVHAIHKHAGGNRRRIAELILRSLPFRCLAVRRVAEAAGPAGPDGVTWQRPSELYEVAETLDVHEYEAQTPRHVALVSTTTREVRRLDIPRWVDRAAMNLLGFATIPTIGAVLSIESRPYGGMRSAQDAAMGLSLALERQEAPDMVVTARVAVEHPSVQRRWIVRNLPMRMIVTKSLLRAGLLCPTEFFPYGEPGMEGASNLTGHTTNLMLDGLERRLDPDPQPPNRSSSPGAPKVYRFGDELAIAVHGFGEAERAMGRAEAFLAERGLCFAETPTAHTTSKGFEFLGLDYRAEGRRVTCRPSETSLLCVVGRLVDTVNAAKTPSADLVTRLNAILSQWGSYYVAFDSIEAFRRVDLILETRIIAHLLKRSPSLDLQGIAKRHFVRTDDGYRFAPSGEHGPRLMRLGEVFSTDPAQGGNPGTDLHATLSLMALADARLGAPPVPYDPRPDVAIIEGAMGSGKGAKRFPRQWRYQRLKRWFAWEDRARFTLTFGEIETIAGCTLPTGAYRSASFWYPRRGTVTIADAWLSENYRIHRLRLDERTLSFRRIEPDRGHVHLQEEITGHRLPPEILAEIFRFMDSIMHRYDLREPDGEGGAHGAP